MKTLIVTHKYPLPENSGDRIRTMNFARYFSNSGRVDVLYFHPADQGMTMEFPFGREILVDKYQGSYGSRLIQLFAKLKYSKPWIVCGYTRECVATVKGVVESEDYDVILCRYAHHAYPLFFLSDALKRRVILDIDDLVSADLYQTMHGAPSRLMRIKSRIDLEFYRSYQRKCARLGYSMVCSEADRCELTRHLDPESLFLVPNVAPTLELREGYPLDGHCNLGTILFVGNLEYQPNVQGITWFITEIFVPLARVEADVTLILAGRNPDPALRSLCNRFARIELVESPVDIAPFYEKCGLVVVPLLAGGGTRIKILEAGYALRPVIATKIGAYGLGLVEYDHLLYMDDFPSFIGHYRWLRDVDNYRTLVMNLHRQVSEHYSIDTFNRTLDRVMGKVVPMTGEVAAAQTAGNARFS